MFRDGVKELQANRLARLCREADGSAVVEFAFAMPLLLAIVFGIVSFGSLMFVSANMLNTARDAARVLAVKSSVPQALTVAQTGLFLGGITYTYNICDKQGGAAPPAPATCDRTQFPGIVDGDVAVEITAPMDQAAIVDWLGLFTGKNLQAKVVMFKETS
jgi:Flp pilus assembly protein TadG